MNEIKTEELIVGQAYTMPLKMDRTFILFPGHIPLQESDISFLTEWQIESVFCDGKVKEGPAKNTWEEFKELYQRAVGVASQFYTQSGTYTEEHKEKLTDVANDFIEFIGADEQIMYNLFRAPAIANKNLEKGLKIAIISLIIAQQLDVEVEKQVEIFIGGILLDIGMLQIPERIRNKVDALSPEEIGEIRKHTLWSYKIITSQLRFDKSIADDVLNHHERYDGSGYPRGLKDENIPLASRIFAIADIYVSLMKKRADRIEKDSYSAMKELLSESKSFDPEIRKVFLGVVALYPVGIHLELSDNSIVQVYQSNHQSPLRPKVRLVVDPMGVKQKGDTVIDLLKSSLVVKKVLPHYDTAA
jgi:response regulator RpfG family c-di-GMP phosphodiesterase